MRRFLIICGILFFLAADASAQNWPWKTFTPMTGEWSITAPGTMVPDNEALEIRGKMGSYLHSDFVGFFGVVYRDWTPSLWTIKPDHSDHFRKVRKDFVKAGKGQLVSEEKFVNGDITGRNVKIRLPFGTITGFEGKTVPKYRYQRLRMFFSGKRFYLLIAILPEDTIDTPQINNYFDSFKVLKVID